MPSSLPRRAVLVGLAIMVLGDFMFATNDAMGKWLVARHLPEEVLVWRSVAAIVVMAPFVRRAGLDGLFVARSLGLQLWRIGFAILELVCFYSAIKVLPLATVMTFYLASPIFTAALAPALLGERVGLRRWLAIAAGFAGVIVAMRPSSASLSVGVLWSVLGSFCLAMMMVTSRRMRDIPDLTIVFQQTVGVLVCGGIWFFVDGAPLSSPTDIPLLGLLGIIATIAHLCINRAVKYAPAAVVAPVNYTLLLWALFYGWCFFGDRPDTMTLAGAAIIIIAGFFLFTGDEMVETPA